MINRIALLAGLFFLVNSLIAQIPGMPGGGGRGGMNREQMNVGHFYGKVVDAKTGKAIEFATVQLTGNKFDSTTKAMKATILGGQITAGNGDFSIEKLPPFGEFTLKISAIGYQTIENKVKFDFKFEMGKPMDMQKAMNAVDKDLGNIKLQSSTDLKEVVVDGGEPAFKLEIDKKVYNVEKSPVSAGGTGEDVLRTIPSITIDIDGNVNLRNAAPQIFVDGRPSSLTLEQIPADAIQSVELITNPSAKYDASGGMGGIVNIVLKKNRKMGYNGGIRAGIDKFGKLNTGADINLRQNKINLFGMLFYNQRRSLSTGYTDRENLTGSPLTTVHQDNKQISDGTFVMGRVGFDYFVDNRNTFTVGFNLGRGQFGPEDEVKIKTDTVSTGKSSSSIRNSSSVRKFNSLGSSLSYKHLFPRSGNELTADVNYNQSISDFNGNFQTDFFLQDGSNYLPTIYQQQTGNGKNNFLTIQTDYVNPFTENTKLETGLRAAYKDYHSLNQNFMKNPSGEFVEQLALTNDYGFKDEVYAAYATLSQKVGKFSFQGGLRLESSSYTGNLYKKDSVATFTNKYPVSLFPSAFVTYRLNDNDDIQFSYTRKINRPNFFQLIPFTDYTDSLNLSKGNPGLKPEFTNSFELSYLKNFSTKSNLLASVYYKNTTGLITRYQQQENSAVLNRPVIMSSYINANQSFSYGTELTLKTELAKWFDVTTNVNIYKAIIDGSNLQTSIRVEQLAWFGKLNGNFKLPKNFSIQLTGEYKSKTALPASGGSRGGGGGMRFSGGGEFFGGGTQASAQGYIRPSYSIDITVKKDLFKNKMGSISVSYRDMFRTDVNFTHSESSYFIQDTFRRRNPQYLRLNFSYRFGKFDVSLFKRKNMNNMDGGGMDAAGGM